MVMGVHETALKRRVGLYAFDLQQQIGLPGIALALVGLASLWRRWRLLAVLVLAYGTAFVFAYTYNVGDVHVFFLPSHQIVILAASLGAAAVWRAPAFVPRVRCGPPASVVLATVLLACRSGGPGTPGRRSIGTTIGVLSNGSRACRSGLGADALLLADVNWQLDNGLDYYTRHVRPDLNVARVADRVLTLPLLVRDNLAAGREVVMTPESRRASRSRVRRTCCCSRRTRAWTRGRWPGGLTACPPIPSTCSRCWRRTATCRLTHRNLPTRRARLTAGAATLTEGPSYQVLAGRVGQSPALVRREKQPFRAAVPVGGRAARRPDGVVAAGRHHPPGRVRPRRGQPPPCAHPGARRVAGPAGPGWPTSRHALCLGPVCAAAAGAGAAGAGPPGAPERAMLGLRGFDPMTAVWRGCPWLVGALLARADGRRHRQPSASRRRGAGPGGARSSATTNRSAISAQTSRTPTKAASCARRRSNADRWQSGSPGACVGPTRAPSRRCSCPTA